MGFGGGGSAGITAHKHNNDSGEGGALDDTTLLDTDKLEEALMIY